MTAPAARTSVFAKAKTLPQGEFISPEDVQSRRVPIRPDGWDGAALVPEKFTAIINAANQE